MRRSVAPHIQTRRDGGRVNKVLVFALAFVVLAPAGSAQANHGDDGRSISGESPFPPACDPPAQTNGRYHMETEPHLAVNPADPNNIAVAWAQDDADGIVVGVSHDGGETWTKSIPPMTSHCAGGNYTSAFNPHLSFGPDGRLYLSTWNHNTQLRTRVTVHVSTDGGTTWSSPVSLEEATIIDLHFLDWSWIVADPTRPGTVYATWISVDLAKAINSVPDSDMGFTRSTDGGATWSPPRTISPAPAGYDRLGPQLAVLPDGSLVNVFLQAHDWPLTDDVRRQPGSVMAARSTDHGNTWSTPVEIAPREIRGETDPRAKKLGTGLVNLPAVSSDGAIYYTWSDIEPDGSSKLHLTSSSDGGVTWTTPEIIRESDVPMGATNIAVGPDNTVGVLFYDFRNDVPNDDEATTDVWFISSPVTPEGLGAWEERHVAGPFDASSVPTHIGSNQGIAGTPGGFVSAYTLGALLSTVGPTDIFFSRLPNNEIGGHEAASLMSEGRDY